MTRVAATFLPSFLAWLHLHLLAYLFAVLQALRQGGIALVRLSIQKRHLCYFFWGGQCPVSAARVPWGLYGCNHTLTAQ